MNTTPDVPDNRDARSCPQCGQALVQVGAFWVCPSHGQVSEPRSFKALRIFLSYGHDANEELVLRIFADLKARGHDIWIDRNEIKAGDDWRRKITEGIVGSHRVVSFLSKHSTRDPGVCRDEIAIAIGVKGGNIQTILVESEQEVQPPVNLGHIQWLDMHDWKEKKATDGTAWEQWYQAKLAEIVRVVESKESQQFAGEIELLSAYLKPIKSDTRIYQLLKKGFYGRQWLFEAVEQWRQDTKQDSRLFWIMGSPGVGKSAFAAQLTHTRGDIVIAAQFVEWDQPDHRNAERVIRSLAFQLATRLPDYRRLLLTLPEINELDNSDLKRQKNASELFNYLLINPLKLVIGGGHERYLIVIDALDEAGEAGRNPLVEMLARNAERLPDWIGLVVTSRPEYDVKTPLQALNPISIDTQSESNRADIRDYLRNELASSLQNRPDADGLVEQILGKSEGVFLYIERFCDDVHCGHLSLDQPDQFPQGLGGIFCQYFQRQFPDKEIYENTIESALGAILAAREPLPIEILQKIFGWRETQLRKWLRTLGSLFPVTTEMDNEVIKPYHKSLADWLTDEANAGTYFVSTVEGHRMLADQLRQFIDVSGRVGDFVRSSLPLHMALRQDWPRFVQALSDVTFLKSLRWSLPDSLMRTAFSTCPSSERASLTVIPEAFAACASGVSLRAAGFPYLHEDTIESVRRAGPTGSFWVQRKDGTRMPLAEMEPDNERLYAFIYACRKMLRCAFDFSSAVDLNRPRKWLADFLETHKQFKDEVDDISFYYARTHFGPSLRAGETVFMWENMLSNDDSKEEHARSAY